MGSIGFLGCCFRIRSGASHQPQKTAYRSESWFSFGKKAAFQDEPFQKSVTALAEILKGSLAKRRLVLRWVGFIQQQTNANQPFHAHTNTLMANMLGWDQDAAARFWEYARHQNKPSLFRPFYTRSVSDLLGALGYGRWERFRSLFFERGKTVFAGFVAFVADINRFLEADKTAADVFIRDLIRDPRIKPDSADPAFYPPTNFFHLAGYGLDLNVCGSLGYPVLVWLILRSPDDWVKDFPDFTKLQALKRLLANPYIDVNAREIHVGGWARSAFLAASTPDRPDLQDLLEELKKDGRYDKNEKSLWAPLFVAADGAFTVSDELAITNLRSV